MYRYGTVTLTLQGDVGDVSFTLTKEYGTIDDPTRIDVAVRALLTAGAEDLLRVYNEDLGGR